METVFADGGHHRVEEVEGVAAAELVVCVALVGDRPGVAVDGGAGSLTGALEVVLGVFELLLGGVDLAAQVAALPARGGVESMSCGCDDAGVLQPLGSRRGVRASRSAAVAAATSARAESALAAAAVA